jgi:hypothetical protein
MNIASKAICATGVTALLLANSPASAWAVEPYQAEAGIPDSATCPASQCEFTFPTVPYGKRLQLTSVSAQLGPASNQIVFEGNGVVYFVTKFDPNLGDLTTPVTLFYEPGSTPTARVYAPNTSRHTSLHITIVGTLEAA